MLLQGHQGPAAEQGLFKEQVCCLALEPLEGSPEGNVACFLGAEARSDRFLRCRQDTPCSRKSGRLNGLIHAA